MQRGVVFPPRLRLGLVRSAGIAHTSPKRKRGVVRERGDGAHKPQAQARGRVSPALALGACVRSAGIAQHKPRAQAQRGVVFPPRLRLGLVRKRGFRLGRDLASLTGCICNHRWRLTAIVHAVPQKLSQLADSHVLGAAR